MCVFFFRFYSSLKKKCAVKVNKKMTDWIKVQRAGPFSLNSNHPTSNVFIADFIELNDFEFPRTIITLNDKLFNELSECTECDKKSDEDNLHKNDELIENDKDSKEINNTIQS